MKLRYSSSDDFNQYTKSIAGGLKKTPLRVLRHEMAKADGFSSVQAYCFALDGQKTAPEASVIHIDGTESGFNARITINDLGIFIEKSSFDVVTAIKDRGLEIWNDYIAQLLLGADLYHLIESPALSTNQNGMSIFCGYIPEDALDDETRVSVIEELLTGWRSDLSNHHAFTSHLLQSVENYFFEVLTEGEVVSENSFETVDTNASKEITSLMASAIPESMRKHYEEDAKAEFYVSNMSLNDVRTIAMNDCYNVLFLEALNRFANSLLLEMEEDELTIKRWEKINAYSTFEINYIERAKNEIFETLMRDIALNKI